MEDVRGHQVLAALSASFSDHTAAPSRTTSFRRNCPGRTDRAGKPPRLGAHPGVENRKLSVVRNIITAIALPTAATRADSGRITIMTATAISTVPRRFENPCTLRKRYIQPMKGLLATRGWIPAASYGVNFIAPIQPTPSTRP